MIARIAGVVAALGVGAFVVGAPAAAHHAIGATVDTTRQVVQDMTLTKVDWINPHAWFHFTLKQPNGTVLRDVMIEWLSLAGMRQSGYESSSVFDVGGVYKVTYNPNRDGSPGGHLVKMVDGEGQVFQR
jgi:hypothetical protein